MKSVFRLTLLFTLLLTPLAARAEDAGTAALKELRIGDHRIEVEVASTREERRLGLMFRQELAENRGMLLAYPQPKRIGLWMRNTPLPLSAAFLDEQGVILNIVQMAPERLDIYLSKGTAKYALEMNQGWFAKRNITPGNRVEGLQERSSPPSP
ncbi:DUF192 domain-containing protein [Endothiovibrio diazotrophicus]